MDLFLFLCHVQQPQGHIAMGSLWVEEPVHTSWSRICTVNHWALASNYQLCNMRHPGQDSNQQPQRLKARIGGLNGRTTSQHTACGAIVSVSVVLMGVRLTSMF